MRERERERGRGRDREREREVGEEGDGERGVREWRKRETEMCKRQLGECKGV